jgi:two-component system alkaline phosphatase synthesis response regulator PhoP
MERKLQGEPVVDLTGKKILVIDDDRDMLRLVMHTFSKTEARIYTAASGEEGLRLFFDQRPDLVVLDIMMPEMDGWEVCRRLRQIADVPIVLLTALEEEEDIIRGLECGAMDYITKPFSPKVLVARARAALRRAERVWEPENLPSYRDDYLAIDLGMRRVLVRGEPVRLTATEFQLLAYLVTNADRVLSPEQILENVWGWEYQGSDNYVHVYVWHLRNKLEEDPKRPCYLLTDHGVGYRFRKNPPARASNRQDTPVAAGSSV